MKNPTTSSIELQIDELVLHGFAPGDRYRIAAALERELARLFAAGVDPQRLADHASAARLEAGAFSMAPDAGPETTGVQVAQAVFGRMSG